MDALSSDLMVMPGMIGTFVRSGFGNLSWHLSKPVQDILHSGFGHFPALHFQEHCGWVHTLWQLPGLQLVVQAGAAQRVRHFGQSPLAQGMTEDGQITAHLGLAHFWVHLSSAFMQRVSHCGGKQTGSHT